MGKSGFDEVRALISYLCCDVLFFLFVLRKIISGPFVNNISHWPDSPQLYLISIGARYHWHMQQGSHNDIAAMAIRVNDEAERLFFWAHHIERTNKGSRPREGSNPIIMKRK